MLQSAALSHSGSSSSSSNSSSVNKAVLPHTLRFPAARCRADACMLFLCTEETLAAVVAVARHCTVVEGI
jgi:hypothetical protein